jgi:hypothetical protein
MLPPPPAMSQAATQTAPAFGKKQHEVAVKLQVEGRTCTRLSCLSQAQLQFEYLAQSKRDAGDLRRKVLQKSTRVQLARALSTLLRSTSLNDEPSTEALAATGTDPSSEDVRSRVRWQRGENNQDSEAMKRKCKGPSSAPRIRRYACAAVRDMPSQLLKAPRYVFAVEYSAFIAQRIVMHVAGSSKKGLPPPPPLV